MDTNRWADRITNELFAKDQNRVDGALEILIDQNRSMGGSPMGFLLGGKFHTLLSYQDRPAAEKRIIVPQLLAEGREYMAEIQRTNQERMRLFQGIANILAICKNNQDVRDAMPNSVCAFFSELSSLPRKRSEAWTLQDKPLQLLNYPKTAELIQFYTANRILF